jgi:hypothetical protein
MAVDRSGLALVSDRAGDRLLVFGPGWTFQGTWGGTGSGSGSWRRPGAVAVGDRPPFLVLDEGNRRVVWIGGLGETLGARELDRTPRGVAVIGPGRYAVAWGEEIEILDGVRAVTERLALRGSPGCTRRPYASSALAGRWPAVLAGEGCSGRLALFRLPED